MTKISELTPEAEILNELGGRLARVRKQRGLTQMVLAEQAGIGVATLRRIEGGQDSQMETWIKLFKALHMTHVIDTLLPEIFKSPMAEALAGSRRARIKEADTAGIVWGDEGL